MSRTLASYSRGPEFKFRPTERPFRGCLQSLQPNVGIIHTKRPRPPPTYLITHRSSNHFILHDPSYWWHYSNTSDIWPKSHKLGFSSEDIRQKSREIPDACCMFRPLSCIFIRAPCQAKQLYATYTWTILEKAHLKGFTLLSTYSDYTVNLDYLRFFQNQNNTIVCFRESQLAGNPESAEQQAETPSRRGDGAHRGHAEKRRYNG
jgi:hypothetical protein